MNINVNTLLFCAWLGSEKQISLTDESLAAVGESVRLWHETVVEPLRAIQQTVKPMPAMADVSVHNLRTDIAQIELPAEQVEQAMLFERTRALTKMLPGHLSPKQFAIT